MMNSIMKRVKCLFVLPVLPIVPTLPNWLAVALFTTLVSVTTPVLADDVSPTAPPRK